MSSLSFNDVAERDGPRVLSEVFSEVRRVLRKEGINNEAGPGVLSEFLKVLRTDLSVAVGAPVDGGLPLITIIQSYLNYPIATGSRIKRSILALLVTLIRTEGMESLGDIFQSIVNTVSLQDGLFGVKELRKEVQYNWLPELEKFIFENEVRIRATRKDLMNEMYRDRHQNKAKHLDDLLEESSREALKELNRERRQMAEENYNGKRRAYDDGGPLPPLPLFKPEFPEYEIVGSEYSPRETDHEDLELDPQHNRLALEKEPRNRASRSPTRVSSSIRERVKTPPAFDPIESVPSESPREVLSQDTEDDQSTMTNESLLDDLTRDGSPISEGRTSRSEEQEKRYQEIRQAQLDFKKQIEEEVRAEMMKEFSGQLEKEQREERERLEKASELLLQNEGEKMNQDRGYDRAPSRPSFGTERAKTDTELMKSMRKLDIKPNPFGEKAKPKKFEGRPFTPSGGIPGIAQPDFVTEMGGMLASRREKLDKSMENLTEIKQEPVEEEPQLSMEERKKKFEGKGNKKGVFGFLDKRGQKKPLWK